MVSHKYSDISNNTAKIRHEIWFENMIDRIIAAFSLIGFKMPQCDSGGHEMSPGQHAKILSLSWPIYSPFWQVEDGCTQGKHEGKL